MYIYIYRRKWDLGELRSSVSSVHGDNNGGKIIIGAIRAVLYRLLFPYKRLTELKPFECLPT